MPRGDKSKYTGKQERKADLESYESRGGPEGSRAEGDSEQGKRRRKEKRFRPRANRNPRPRRKRAAGLAANHRPAGQRPSVQPRSRGRKRRASP